jgi:lycopene cyclase domain-containing protein
MPEFSLMLLFLLFLTGFLHFFYKVKIFKSKSHLIFLYIVLLFVGIIWDQYAIYRGHWSFGKNFLLGLHIGYMPIEEYAFIFIVTYFILVAYKIIENRLKG